MKGPSRAGARENPSHLDDFFFSPRHLGGSTCRWFVEFARGTGGSRAENSPATLPAQLLISPVRGTRQRTLLHHWGVTGTAIPAEFKNSETIPSRMRNENGRITRPQRPAVNKNRGGGRRRGWVTREEISPSDYINHAAAGKTED